MFNQGQSGAYHKHSILVLVPATSKHPLIGLNLITMIKLAYATATSFAKRWVSRKVSVSVYVVTQVHMWFVA